MLSGSRGVAPLVSAPSKNNLSLTFIFPLPAASLGLLVAMLDGLAVLCVLWIVRSLLEDSHSLSWNEVQIVDGSALCRMILVIAAAASFGFYHTSELLRPWKRAGLTLFMTAAVVIVGIAVAQKTQITIALIGAGAAMLALCCATRAVWPTVLERLAAHGLIKGKPVVVLGFASELQPVTPSLLLRHYGLCESDRVALPVDGDLTEDAVGREIDLVLEHARRNRARAIIVAVSWSRFSNMTTLVRALRASPLPVFLLPLETTCGGVDALGRSDLFDLQQAPIGQVGLALKRLLDVTLASLMLIFLLPVFVCVALAVRTDSPGPIVFRQTRSGLDRRPFTILKFRSMSVLEDGESVRQAERADRRVTRVGRWLRRTSIDELPQLINVLWGDMSLVGPRPHALAHDQLFRTVVEEYNLRHHVKPGITGWAQIGGARGETVEPGQVQRRVALDLWYIRNWSPLLDVKILFCTALDFAFHDAY